MGTHPIFESDFDCLTEFEIGEYGPLVASNFRHCYWFLGRNRFDWPIFSPKSYLSLFNSYGLCLLLVTLVPMFPLTSKSPGRPNNGSSKYQHSSLELGGCRELTIEDFKYIHLLPELKLLIVCQF